MEKTRSRHVRALTTASGKSADEIIIGGLPAIFDISKLSRIRIQGTAFETFCYEGRPFLELHDPEFDHGFDGDKYMLKVVQKYRYLSAADQAEPPHLP